MASRFRIVLAAGLFCSAPAYAKTGNFLPLILSLLVAIPILQLVPAIAIACGRQEWKRKLPWAFAALAVALLSFGTLLWAARVYALLANSDWYIIYLWALPPYLLWPFARKQLKRDSG